MKQATPPQAPDATLSRLAQPATAGTATKASSVKKTAVGLDTEEVRIATTMTGGVSLAIWMGGVAREIDLLMQASQFRRALQGGEPDHRTPEPGEIANSAAAQERELYSRLLEFLDIVVEVDILSGTSAGGINAIMLAYARVRNGSLEQLRDIWFEVGALLDLLREPTDSDVPSLLYGDRRMLRALNDELPRLATGMPPRHPPSTTLYVTTTLLTGETGRFTDSLGTLVQDSNHHGLFTFTQKDLIAGGIEGALAVAGRSTASFPGAFEPGFIPCHEATKAAGGIPERPAMGRFINITRSHFCVDGGMTDNQPLDVLLERVFERRASRPVRRVLLFVVPSAGPAADAIAAAPADLISAPYGLLSGLLKDVDAATSQSIGSSLQAILAHNDRFTARTDLRMHLAAMGARLAPHRLLTPRLLADYRTRESTRQARVLVTAMMRLLATWPPQPSPSPTSVGIPPGWHRSLKPGGDAEQVCRQAAEEALTSAWTNGAGQTTAEEATQPAELPATQTEIAAYGRSAYDEGKSFALAVLRCGYDAATTAEDRRSLTESAGDLHSILLPVDKSSAARLALDACTASATKPRKGAGHRSLAETAAAIATEWARQAGVPPQAWDDLGKVLYEKAELLARIAAGTAPDSAIASYVSYLGLGDSTTSQDDIVTRLFDLTATEGALTPVDVGVYQAVELVQLSADTRGLLTPANSTATSKLTGLQFHHFGAFYKKSWRANDWMWGRLDGAGWLVHALLDPRRLRRIAETKATGDPLEWVMGKLDQFGAVELPPGPAAEAGLPTRAAVREELKFLKDSSARLPSSLPTTSLWLATAWQRHIAEQELPVLAQIILGQDGTRATPDRSPSATRAWAQKVLQPDANLTALLNQCPVARETLATDKGSPLMVHTISKAAATTTAAVSSIQQMPRAVRPAVATAHTIALGGYRAANAVRAHPRRLILAGLVLLAVGIGAAVQSVDIFGIAGLIIAAVGGYLVTFGVWQISLRLLAALLSATLIGAIAALASPVVRHTLFGSSEKNPGWIGRHVYLLGTVWWHPLLVVAVVVLLVAVPSAAFSVPKRLKRRA